MVIDKHSEQLNLLWLRAAILGSIWASSEIILGSFLHNLRIPFSGTFLGAIGVYLLAAFDAKWKQSGVIIRAGIICAFMKSISPSAVIFGPMIAIILESLLFTIVIRIVGRNSIGYGLAGAFAVTYSLIHKIANLLIFYGADIIQIYANFYKYAVKVTSINLGAPGNLIAILFMVYLCSGFIVGIAGMLAGKNASPLTLESVPSDSSSFPFKSNSVPFTRHSIGWFLFHCVTLISGLYALSNYSLTVSLIIVIGISCINLLHYKKHLSRRFKLKFWLELSVVTILAGLFFGGFQEAGWQFSWTNLQLGFTIALRALLLTQCFTLLGTELLNPSIKSLLNKYRFQKLQAALETAFQALPLLLAILSTHKSKLKTPSVLISGFITFADNWVLETSNRYKL